MRDARCLIPDAWCLVLGVVFSDQLFSVQLIGVIARHEAILLPTRPVITNSKPEGYHFSTRRLPKNNVEF